jgi:hypothetical protein
VIGCCPTVHVSAARGLREEEQREREEDAFHH